MIDDGRAAINEFSQVIECVHGPIHHYNFRISANAIGARPPSVLDNEVTRFAEWRLVFEVRRRQKDQIDQGQFNKVMGYIKAGRESGAKLVTEIGRASCRERVSSPV